MEEGGTWRISHDFLLSWLRVKNHRLESVDSQEFFIGKNARRRDFPRAGNFFSTAKILWHPAHPVMDGIDTCVIEKLRFFLSSFFSFFFLFLGDNSSCRDSRVFERFVILLANLLFGYLLWLVKLIKSDDYWYIF